MSPGPTLSTTTSASTGHFAAALSCAAAAPISSACARFCSLRLVTSTLAPIVAPSANAAHDTPEPMPTTSKVSPDCRRARRSMRYAVRYANGKAAHSCQLRVAGRLRTLRSGAIAVSP